MVVSIEADQLMLLYIRIMRYLENLPPVPSIILPEVLLWLRSSMIAPFLVHHYGLIIVFGVCPLC